MCDPLTIGLSAAGGLAGGAALKQLTKTGPDPAAERARAENAAQANANAVKAQRQKSIRASSVLATGAQGVTQNATTSSVLAQGRTVTGG